MVVASVEVINVQYESFNKEISQDDQYISQELKFEATVFNDRGDYYLYYSFIPIIKTGSGQFKRVVSFEIKLNYTQQTSRYGTNNLSFPFNFRKWSTIIKLQFRVQECTKSVMIF